MKSCVHLLLVLALAGNPSFADSKTNFDRTGAAWLPGCKSAILMWENDGSLTTEQIVDAIGCSNYVRGFWEGSDSAYALLAAQRANEQKKKTIESQFYSSRLWCSPHNNNVSVPQTIRVFVKYMEEHPEELHEKVSILATRAFMKAFPCK